MKITGKTRIFTILAHPAIHVTAPIIYNHMFGEMSLDMAYIAHDVHPNAIKETLGAFQSWNNLGGFNVTVPHKESTANFLKNMCPVSARIKAVNTVVRSEDGSFNGYNTDGLGAQKAIGPVKGETCLVIGAGGAARSIVHALVEAGAHHIFILNRSEASAHRLINLFQDAGLSIFDNECLESIDVVIQATPVTDRIPFDLDLGRLQKHTRILETVMRPTVLTDNAMEYGLEVIPGYAMLYHQTKKNFYLLTGMEVPNMVLNRAFQSVGYKQP